mmetsp:Transcript_26888/g.41655  ORF Transcript_26888/g.41655 Transcript_26888/m.41655 type:complete len:124 (+) Transcript_26888:96-467(+)
MLLSQAQRELFHQHGYFINENGGAYLSGTSLGYTKKVEVASVYERAREDCGERPNISATALKGFLTLGTFKREIQSTTTHAHIIPPYHRNSHMESLLSCGIKRTTGRSHRAVRSTRCPNSVLI